MSVLTTCDQSIKSASFMHVRLILFSILLVFPFYERPTFDDEPKPHKSCKLWQASLFCNNGLKMITKVSGLVTNVHKLFLFQQG